MTTPSLQLRIAAALATIREDLPQRSQFLVDALEEYIDQERKTANLALALLRSNSYDEPGGPDLGGYEQRDPKAWTLKNRP